MLNVRLATGRETPDVLALPVTGPDGPTLPDTTPQLDPQVRDEAQAFAEEVRHTGGAGVLHTLPRPLRNPRTVYLVGVGPADATGSDVGSGWRAAGAALAREVTRHEELAVALPAGVDPDAVGGLAEGLWLASYRFSLASRPDANASKLATVTLLVDDPDRYTQALERARTVAEHTCLARDLTNQPSDVKTPQ